MKILPNVVSKKMLPLATAAAIGTGAMFANTSNVSEQKDTVEIVNTNQPEKLTEEEAAQRFVDKFIQGQMNDLDKQIAGLRKSQKAGKMSFKDYYLKSRDLINKANIGVPKDVVNKATTEERFDRTGAGIILSIFSALVGAGIAWYVIDRKNENDPKYSYFHVPHSGLKIGLSSLGGALLAGGLAFGLPYENKIEKNFQVQKEQRIYNLELEKQQYMQTLNPQQKADFELSLNE